MSAFRFCLLVLVYVQCALSITGQSWDDGDICPAGAVCHRSLLQAQSITSQSMVMRHAQENFQTSSDTSMAGADGQNKPALIEKRCGPTIEESRVRVNQVPLTDAGFQAVQQYCVPMYMQEFIRRVVNEKFNGQVCIEGALSGVTGWYYCNNGQVSGLGWSNLLQDVDLSGRAGGGDCPWVGASGSSCPPVVQCLDFPVLTQTPCKKRTATPLVLTSTTTTTTQATTTYQAFRFTTTKTRTANNPVQIAEIEFGVNGQAVSLTGAVASNPGGRNPRREEPGKAIDGSVRTKWLDFNVGTLNVTLLQPIYVNSFRFITANDASRRDPVQWQCDAQQLSGSWVSLHSQSTDFATPTARYTATTWFQQATTNTTTTTKVR